MVTPVCLNSTLVPSRMLRGDTTQPQQSHVELLALDSEMGPKLNNNKKLFLKCI